METHLGKTTKEIFIWHEKYISTFAMTKLKYLGYVIDSADIHFDLEKVKILKYWPIPQNIHELRRFLGLDNFYRCFILRFSHLAWPLNQLTKGNGKIVFKWILTQQ